ncbi:LamG-like jellyroll fold domain-containing protein [Haliangium sp.]|uniref:LamG-like jellyroll fold domain-containing protein n=1 Tax=Haliangium sp. TaxID=2663208 RepID=UPI003D10C173
MRLASGAAGVGLGVVFALAGCGEIRKIEADAGSSPPPAIDAAVGECTDLLVDGVSGCDFGAGDFVGTRFATGSGVTLSDGRDSGEFVSRVFDSGESGTVWSSLTWATDGPHGVPLPDDGAGEDGYLRDGADMADNVLLLHLEDGAISPGRQLVDSSGRGNRPVLTSTASDELVGADGRFGRALIDTLDSHFYIDIDPTGSPAVGDDFGFGEGGFTWALWLETGQDCSDNRVYMGAEGYGVDGYIHMWLGCNSGDAPWCAPGSPGGRVGGFITSAQEIEDYGVGVCGLSQINDDAWHHIALVKAGHAPATVSLYVDGAVEFSEEFSFGQPFQFAEPVRFIIGSFGSYADDLLLYQAEGRYDELAIWRRALDAEEVAAMYRRGGLRVGFQVRACSEPGCADDPPFVGPDGSETRLYRAPSGGTGPERAVALDGVSGRYLQYRAVLESDIPDESPVLRRVALSLTP